MSEMVLQVSAQVIGNDATIAFAGSGLGSTFELNVMMPVMAQALLDSITLLANASRVFADRCVSGIEADAAQCAYWLERSPALVTALAPRIGYAEAAKLAKEALSTNLTVRQLVMDKGLLTPQELDAVLDLRAMTEPGVPGARNASGE
jgi:fumarate hydratase class II